MRNPIRVAVDRATRDARHRPSAELAERDRVSDRIERLRRAWDRED